MENVEREREREKRWQMFHLLSNHSPSFVGLNSTFASWIWQIDMKVCRALNTQHTNTQTQQINKRETETEREREIKCPDMLSILMFLKQSYRFAIWRTTFWSARQKLKSLTTDEHNTFINNVQYIWRMETIIIEIGHSVEELVVNEKNFSSNDEMWQNGESSISSTLLTNEKWEGYRFPTKHFPKFPTECRSEVGFDWDLSACVSCILNWTLSIAVNFFSIFTLLLSWNRLSNSNTVSAVRLNCYTKRKLI